MMFDFLSAFNIDLTSKSFQRNETNVYDTRNVYDTSEMNNAVINFTVLKWKFLDTRRMYCMDTEWPYLTCSCSEDLSTIE